MDLQLIGAPQSNFVWTTRIVCAEKGAPYTLVPAFAHTPEVDAIHPFGRIPALRHGDFTLCESLAICGYVDDVFPSPSLTPAAPRQRAAVMQWVSLIITTIDPILMRRYGVPYAFPHTPDGAPDRALIDAAWPDAKNHLALLEKAVASGHLAGDAFSLADAYLVPILYYMRLAPESGPVVDGSPSLSGYLERHLARPAVHETTPPPFPVEGSSMRRLMLGEYRNS